MNKIDEIEYVMFIKEFDIGIIQKIEGRIDQYKGISQKDNIKYTLKYIQFKNSLKYRKI